MNIQTIEKVIRLSDDSFIFIDDLKCLLFNELPYVTTDIKKLTETIKENILEKSLVFLNPAKIIDSAVTVFYALIQELSLDYHEDLFIRFTLHISFLVERMLLKNILTYQNIKEFINKNYETNTIIDRHMNTIRNTYNVVIPQSEIAYITEICLEKVSGGKD